MASFDREDGMSMIDPNIQKFPIRRLVPSLNRFIKVLGAALDRLHQHKTYIMRYDKRQDWENLDRELVNATRTMQQIKANMREVDRTRRQVATEDLCQFDEKIEDIKVTASADVAEFIAFSNDLIALIHQQKQDNEGAEENENVISIQTERKNDIMSEPMSSLLTDDMVTTPNDKLMTPNPVVTGKQQMQLQPLPENSDVMESWDTLQESLVELNSLVHQFATAVHNQQEAVDRIEDNIEKSSSSVWEGVKELGKAAKYKTVLVPLAGALLGAVVAGPVGLLVGAKVGGLAVIGGGVAGAAGGKILQKRQKHIVEMEMANMRTRRLSDDGTCVQDKKPNIERSDANPDLDNMNT